MKKITILLLLFSIGVTFSACLKESQDPLQESLFEVGEEFSGDLGDGVTLTQASEEDLKIISLLQKEARKVETRSSSCSLPYPSSTCIERNVEYYYSGDDIYFRAGACFDPASVSSQLRSTVDLNYRQIVFHAQNPNGQGWYGANGVDLDGLLSSSSCTIPSGCNYMYATEHYCGFGTSGYGNASWTKISGDICGKTFHVYTQLELFLNGSSQPSRYPTGSWIFGDFPPTVKLKLPGLCTIDGGEDAFGGISKGL